MESYEMYSLCLISSTQNFMFKTHACCCIKLHFIHFHWSIIFWTSQVVPVVKNLPVNAGDARDMGLIPGRGRSPGVGNGNPLQYTCLENSMDRGAWCTIVHAAAKSRTRRSNWELYIPLYGYMTIYLPILRCWHFVLSKFWLLGIMQPWTGLYMLCFLYLFFCW